MRLLLVSDIHGKTSTIERTLKDAGEIDAILIAGDVSSYTGLGWGDVLSIVSKHCKRRNITAFLVPGNVDPPSILSTRYEGINVLHASAGTLGEYIVAGVGGGLGFSFWRITRLTDAELAGFVDSLLRKHGGGLAPYSWILLTHTPPYGTKLDIMYTGEHVGSKALRTLIEVRKPLLVVSGHIHESRNVDYLGRTVLINPGPNYRGFYALAEVNGMNVKVELLNVKRL